MCHPPESCLPTLWLPQCLVKAIEDKGKAAAGNPNGDGGPSASKRCEELAKALNTAAMRMKELGIKQFCGPSEAAGSRWPTVESANLLVTSPAATAHSVANLGRAALWFGCA